MASFQHNHIKFHYQEMGAGEPIIALHGLAQHSDYWMKTGVAAQLAKHYRVIALDIRGHGLTKVEGKEKGYHIDRCLEDVNRLADHLDLDSFHLMGHSTGGMIAVRYAMLYANNKNNAEHSRLLSLILCNTSSSTQFSNLSDSANKTARHIFASSFENFSWPMIIQGLKFNGGPLFSGISAAENSSELFELCLEIMQDGDGQSIGEFVRSFYNDSNPHIEGLKTITCPTLVITAEKDRIFNKTSELFLKHIANTTHSHHLSAGHMTAVECPDWLAQEVLSFLQTKA